LLLLVVVVCAVIYVAVESQAGGGMPTLNSEAKCAHAPETKPLSRCILMKRRRQLQITE